MISVYIISQVSGTFWAPPDLTNKPVDTVLIGLLAEQLFTSHGVTVISLGLLILGAMLGSVYLVKKEVDEV
jgi:NADH:ubiquinone oxidoreductase subunit 6 (subunit J)